MIERDDFQGPPNSANPPRQKKLYLFDLTEVDPATGLLEAATRRSPRHRRPARHRWAVDRHSRRQVQLPAPVSGIRDPGRRLHAARRPRQQLPRRQRPRAGTPDSTEIILRSQVPLRTLRAQPCKDESLGARNGKDDPRGGAGASEGFRRIVEVEMSLRTNTVACVAVLCWLTPSSGHAGDQNKTSGVQVGPRPCPSDRTDERQPAEAEAGVVQ